MNFENIEINSIKITKYTGKENIYRVYYKTRANKVCTYL